MSLPMSSAVSSAVGSAVADGKPSRVRVQQEDFDLSAELARLRAGNPKVGAIVSFVGTVRDMNEGSHVASMEL